jgi:DnaJ like chaperone protein
MILVIVISVMLLAFIVFLLFRRKENEPVSAEMSEITVAEAQTTEIVKDRSSAVAFAHLAGWLIKKNSSEPKNRIVFALDYFKEHFDADFHLEQELFRSLDYAIHIRSAASGINRKMKRAPERKQLIDFLIGLAFADGDINQREYVAIMRFGSLIGVQLQYIEKVVTAKRAAMNYGRNSTIDLLSNYPYKRKMALEQLGLQETASDGEIKKTFRKLVKTWHPDKFMNDSEDNRLKAAETFRKIREAYEFLTS